MPNKFSSALVYRVAKYYYADNLTQNDIATRESISRSTVSRILDQAKESGIVKIEINVPTGALIDALSERLRAVLSIERVIVVPASVSESTPETEEQLIIDVASIAAVHLPGLLSNACTIGVGWGRTLYNITPHLSYTQASPELMFVPLVGNKTLHNRFLQTSINVSRFGEKFGSQTCYLNISSYHSPGETFNEAERVNIQQIKNYWDCLDAAVFSIGAPPVRNDIYLKDELGMERFSETDNDPEAQGEMLSQVFFSDGRKSCPIGNDMSVVAIPLERLNEVPITVCVAAGNYKAVPIYHAAKNGYIKTLIVDHLLAEEILYLAQKQAELKGIK